MKWGASRRTIWLCRRPPQRTPVPRRSGRWLWFAYRYRATSNKKAAADIPALRRVVSRSVHAREKPNEHCGMEFVRKPRHCCFAGRFRDDERSASRNNDPRTSPVARGYREMFLGEHEEVGLNLKQYSIMGLEVLNVLKPSYSGRLYHKSAARVSARAQGVVCKRVQASIHQIFRPSVDGNAMQGYTLLQSNEIVGRGPEIIAEATVPEWNPQTEVTWQATHRRAS